MPSSTWLTDATTEAATARILDAARDAFAAKGVAATTMTDIAAAAGCSRGTVYRYFENRDALRLAFIHREMRRINREMLSYLDACPTVEAKLVEAVVRSVDAVRRDPVVQPFFTPEALGLTQRLAGGSALLFGEMTRWVEHIIASAADRNRLRDDIEAADAAEWLVRVILSLLSVPGPTARDLDDDRAYLERWLLPAFVRGE